MTSENTDPRYANLSEAKRKLLLQRLHGKSTSQPSVPSVPKRPPGAARIASAGQRRIWLAEQMNVTSAAYNITSCLDFSSPLDSSRLEQALNKVVSRHEALKSVFTWDTDQLLYEVNDHLELKVEKERVACLDEKANFHARTLFDLSAGPLLKLALLESERGHGKLVLVIHHIVFDEWSLAIFWQEFQRYYNSPLLQEPQLPQAQFYDFAYWQNNQLQQGVFGSQLEYWTDRLAGAASYIDLPVDSANKPSASDAGSVEKIEIDPKTSESLRHLSRTKNVSVFSTLLAAFNVLLYKYSNQNDIVVGTPIANRTKQAFSDTIGFFLNTAAIRTTIAGSMSFTDLLGHTHERVLEALENQDIPFDTVIEQVKPERVQGKPPLVQIMFVYQKDNEAAPVLELDGQKLKHATTQSNSAKLDLTLFAVDSENTIELIFEYKTDLFERDTIQALLRQYRNLVEHIADKPQLNIADLEILSPSEKQELQKSSEGEAIEIEERPLLHEQIFLYSKSNPSNIAIESVNEKLTYERLGERVASLASLLAANGATREAPIAIYLPRSVDAIVAILAVLRAGTHYVALDPSYPSLRTRYIIEDAVPSLILSSPELEEAISAIASIPVLTDLNPQRTGLAGPTTPSALAYIIYTSGSTGQPKGVEITHKNLVYSTFARTHYYPKNPDRFLLIPSLSFDSSVAALFWTLSRGGTLVIPNQGDEKDPFKLSLTIEKKQVTTLLCIPSLYHEILKVEPQHLDSLDTVIVAGEDCLPLVVDSHFKAIPHCSLYNEYGPTEATVWCSVEKLLPQSRVSIGKPIANYGTYVLDQNQKLLPDQIPGELFIGGPGLARGYRNQEKLTEKAFAAVRLDHRDPVRMYRTGDRVRRTKDGRLEILGRIDRQIKIRGFRLELGEVEAQLGKLDGVREAAVLPIVRESEYGGSTQLVAYLGVSNPSSFRIADCRKSLADQLPTHAIPSHFIALETLPKLPNGKIDRSSLPTLETHYSEENALNPPQTSTETKLAELWKSILSLPSVSTDDSFFDLGGTSIQAIWLFSKIREEFQTRVSPSQLLHSPTISALAKLIEKKSSNTNLRNIVCLQEGSDLPPIFLVHAAGQELLFYKALVNRLDKRIPIYGIQPIGHDGTESPIENMKKIIDRYSSEILSIQSTGPFHIVGHCQGGYFAMELAKRLKSVNQSLGLICSIDGRAPRTNKIASISGTKRRSKLGDTIKRKLYGIKWRSRRLGIHIKYLFYLKYGNQRQKSDAIYRESFMAVSNSINRHITNPFESEILVLQCLDSAKYPGHSTEHWKRSAPNARFIEFECLHHEILEEPYVADTARAIMQRYFEKS